MRRCGSGRTPAADSSADESQDGADRRHRGDETPRQIRLQVGQVGLRSELVIVCGAGLPSELARSAQQYLSYLSATSALVLCDTLSNDIGELHDELNRLPAEIRCLAEPNECDVARLLSELQRTR